MHGRAEGQPAAGVKQSPTRPSSAQNRTLSLEEFSRNFYGYVSGTPTFN
jgi:hypothetical protein